MNARKKAVQICAMVVIVACISYGLGATQTEHGDQGGQTKRGLVERVEALEKNIGDVNVANLVMQLNTQTGQINALGTRIQALEACGCQALVYWDTRYPPASARTMGVAAIAQSTDAAGKAITGVYTVTFTKPFASSRDYVAVCASTAGGAYLTTNLNSGISVVVTDRDGRPVNGGNFWLAVFANPPPSA